MLHGIVRVSDEYYLSRDLPPRTYHSHIRVDAEPVQVAELADLDAFMCRYAGEWCVVDGVTGAAIGWHEEKSEALARARRRVSDNGADDARRRILWLETRPLSPRYAWAHQLEKGA